MPLLPCVCIYKYTSDEKPRSGIYYTPAYFSPPDLIHKTKYKHSVLLLEVSLNVLKRLNRKESTKTTNISCIWHYFTLPFVLLSSNQPQCERHCCCISHFEGLFVVSRLLLSNCLQLHYLSSLSRHNYIFVTHCYLRKRRRKKGRNIGAPFRYYLADTKIEETSFKCSGRATLSIYAQQNNKIR